MTSALAKDVAMQVVSETMQIHGGYGYMKEMGIERFYRYAQFLEIFGYSREDLKTFVAKEKEVKKKLEKQIPEEYKTDNQLMQAVDVLKAIKIYRRPDYSSEDSR